MIYFYNYNFIKYLNSAWSFLFLLLFANIALLLLTSTCLADGEVNPNSNLNTNLEGKEIINNLPEDNVVRKTCEETGISLSDAIFQHKMQLKVAERLQIEVHSLSLLDEIRSWKPEDSKHESVVITNDQRGLNKDPKQYNNSFNLEDLPIPAKFVLGVTAFGLSGGSISRNFASYSMHPPLKGIAACKLPFILKPIPVPIIGRIGATVGASIFIGGICTGCIDLKSFDCSGAVSSL